MKVLLTGAAGFIGSNLAYALLNDDRFTEVIGIDNFSTGYKQNLVRLQSSTKFRFIECDICNYNDVLAAMADVNLVCHQAALGSVPRSIKDPLRTNEVNITGTLNILHAAVAQKVNRVVYAASSSTYGDSTNLPKVEHIIGKPLSPYAVTKYVMELYASVFATAYGLNTIGLRYFNVFGPCQSPTGAYAAVIPLFISSVLANTPATINGDGTICRDFTYIDNVVEANIAALTTQNSEAFNQVFNIAYGESTTLNELYAYIAELCNSSLKPIYGEPRLGDIQQSLADITKAKTLLSYSPKVSVKEGLKHAIAWYKQNASYFN